MSLQQVTLTPKVAVLPLPKHRAILRMPNDHNRSVLTLKIKTIPFHIATGQKGLCERLEVDFRRQDRVAAIFGWDILSTMIDARWSHHTNPSHQLFRMLTSAACRHDCGTDWSRTESCAGPRASNCPIKNVCIGMWKMYDFKNKFTIAARLVLG